MSECGKIYVENSWLCEMRVGGRDNSMRSVK